MSRRKALPDQAVLESALRLIRTDGSGSLTFSKLATSSGLSASTLVQRFGTKQQLIEKALQHAWDQLDEQTSQAVAAAERTPRGAVEILTRLSATHGDIDEYADDLLILREDLRDPASRSRGTAWGKRLATALNDCFATTPQAPEGIGQLMATHWQGALTWWGFDPTADIETYVRNTLTGLLETLECLPSGGSASE
ncbi:TetR/AcrR family transcriptional regulator [Nocardia otitidiscaviarum]|uniref:TetR/AcrR family transcriptional regulator n=1 Tax=Nocardia otitidiscaviarum TaxID=1823 RepID=UPI0004A70CAA|nr:TetR family transcriptional regulator [Nocardia otitidiscaviarum]